jgi:cyclic beta-1,2-glucan synthetase
MLNPLTHGRTPDEVKTYKVEPYVVAADVYTAPGQLGRGGWTWYTGSASWMYRVGLKSILGFAKRGDTLRFEPAVPDHWPDFSVEYRHGDSTYAIILGAPSRIGRGVAVVILDGRRIEEPFIPLIDDGQRPVVVVSPGVPG